MFPIDKRYHFFAGMGISFLVGLIFGSFFWAFAFAALAGALKEWVYDLYMNRRAEKADLPRPHDVDGLDFMFTCAGGLFVLLLLAILRAVS